MEQGAAHTRVPVGQCRERAQVCFHTADARDGWRSSSFIPAARSGRTRTTHAWSVAKGEIEPDEDLLHAAHREFSEETGLTLAGRAIPLAPIRQASGKLVHVWAIEADIDPSVVQSNSFPLEWPPRSGQVRQFPEVDRAAWFDLAEARSKIHKGQVAIA